MREFDFGKLYNILICLLIAGLLVVIPLQTSYAEEVQEITAAEESYTADTDLDDSDNLLEQFVTKEVQQEVNGPVDSPMLLRSSRGSRLSGNTRIVYEYLAEGISDIAEGKTTSTVIEIPLSDYISESDRYVTAEQLGLSSTISDGAIDSSAMAYMNSLFEYDGSKVLSALLNDLPYEFFWYDKTPATGGVKYKFNIAANGKAIYFQNSTPVLRFRFSVSSDYSASGETGTNEIDADKVGTASAAASNAAEIITNYSDYSDSEKVSAYKEDICALTAYNESATDEAAYGDPWQMIYVFDGDTSTKVVCEGYAKAFDFLCDNSDFDSGIIDCYTVTGTVGRSGATGSKHMWNIICMDDGNRYLADLTNCDAGMIGYPSDLFLKRYASGDVSSGYTFDCSGTSILYTYDDTTADQFSETELTLADTDYAVPEEAVADHEHTYSSWTIVKAATFDTVGLKERTCSECGEIEQEKLVLKAASLKNRTYTGSAIKPAVTVTLNGTALVVGTDYSVKYSSNKNVGTAKVKITGLSDEIKGSTTTLTFKIKPKGRSISKLVRAKKAFTVKWSKLSTKMSKYRIAGYQIQYSTTEDFSSNVKEVNVKGYKNTYKKIKGLKSGKKYYVRMRTFLKTGGVYYYSSWSAVKSVKTK